MGKRTIMRATYKDESGFTFVEVMVALAILSISILALLGLISSSTVMSHRARRLSQVTDAVAAVAEQLRLQGSTDTGYNNLGRQTTWLTESGAFDVIVSGTFKTTVRDRTEVKLITLTGRSRAGKPEVSDSVSIVIRNPLTEKVEELGESATAPTFDEFCVLDPLLRDTPDGGIVFNNALTETAYITYNARATAPDATVTRVSLYADNKLIKTIDNPAEGTRAVVAWNILEKSYDSGKPRFPDGPVTIRWEAEDSSGNIGVAERRFVIDNEPVTNTIPTNLRVLVGYTNGITVKWDPIPDPAENTNYAMRYRVVLTVTAPSGESTEYIEERGATTAGGYPDNYVNFPTVNKNQGFTYTVRIYPMCPRECATQVLGIPHHSSQVSTGYLEKTF